MEKGETIRENNGSHQHKNINETMQSRELFRHRGYVSNSFSSNTIVT